MIKKSINNVNTLHFMKLRNKKFFNTLNIHKCSNFIQIEIGVNMEVYGVLNDYDIE